MNPLFGSPLGSLQLVESCSLCLMTFVRWRRTHRQKRIQKKWAKKYGAVMACKQEQAYQIGNRILMCPHMAAAVKRELSQLSPSLRPSGIW